MILARSFKAGKGERFIFCRRGRDGEWLPLDRGLKAMAKVMATVRVEESANAKPRLKQDRGCLGSLVSNLVLTETILLTYRFDSSILRRDLILLQLPIRHLIRPGPQNFLRKSDYVNPQGHPAAQPLARLNERLGRAQRPHST